MNRNLTATVLIIIAIGIYFTVTKDVIAGARAVKAVNDEYVAAIKNADKLKSELEGIVAKYQLIPEADRNKLDLMIPSSVDNIRLIIDLTSLAMNNGFTISNVKADVPSKTQTFGSQTNRIQTTPPTSIPGISDSIVSPQVVSSEPRLDKVLVSFNAETTYEKFGSFLQAVEASLRIMDISRLSVEATDEGTYKFAVEIQTYWLRQ